MHKAITNTNMYPYINFAMYNTIRDIKIILHRIALKTPIRPD